MTCPPELDPAVLLGILEMVREAESVGYGPQAKRVSTGSLKQLLGSNLAEGDPIFKLNKHLEFLHGFGYLELGGQYVGTNEYHNIRITPLGRLFLQPELAGFAGRLWPQFVTFIEQHIHEAPVPDDLKQNWAYRLSEAAVKQAVTELFELVRDMFRSGAL